MNRRNIIHTVFFMTYAGLNVGLYQLSSHIEFSVVGQFVLAPLVIIVGASVLYAMDQFLVSVISPANETVSDEVMASQQAVDRAVKTDERPLWEGAIAERRVQSEKLAQGRKDRRRPAFISPLATGI